MMSYNDDLAAIAERLNDRNGPHRVKIECVAALHYMLAPVWADRHGRLWKWDCDTDEMVVILDPNEAKF